MTPATQNIAVERTPVRQPGSKFLAGPPGVARLILYRPLGGLLHPARDSWEPAQRAINLRTRSFGMAVRWPAENNSIL